MTPRRLAVDAVEDLRRIALVFDEASEARKSAALARCAARAIDDPIALVAYHDCLLCLLAYPQTHALRGTARAELVRVARAARQIVVQGPARSRAKLANTGIAWTPVTIGFGWDIARWLSRRFPKRAEIDSLGNADAPLATILAAALPAIESELVARDEDPADLLEAASAGHRRTRLGWLVTALERLQCDDALRAYLFDTLEAYIAIEPADSMLSRTFVRGLPAPTFYHRNGLARSVDLASLLERPLPPLRRLTQRSRQHIVNAGRATLAALGRETDAIALAYPDGVAWHELERGIAVALYTMEPARRSPLDSHIGMMLFKNGIPVGYGGGWPFAGTCRIGVNIFAPFRGGESALLFGQVLRVYRQRFAVGRFIAEPSQFGGTNKEGLQSGAFWFYYRLGFRPLDARAARLAAAEWLRMRAEHGYRTPLSELRRFTRSDIELRLRDTPSCEPADLSGAATAWIDAHHDGDRSSALSAARRMVTRALGGVDDGRWPKSEQSAFRELALLVAQIRDVRRWSAADKRALVAWMRAKGGDEFRFHRILARHRRLREALCSLGASGDP
jgi:hypothetical protein